MARRWQTLCKASERRLSAPFSAFKRRQRITPLFRHPNIRIRTSLCTLSLSLSPRRVFVASIELVLVELMYLACPLEKSTLTCIARRRKRRKKNNGGRGVSTSMNKSGAYQFRALYSFGEKVTFEYHLSLGIVSTSHFIRRASQRTVGLYRSFAAQPYRADTTSLSAAIAR